MLNNKFYAYLLTTVGFMAVTFTTRAMDDELDPDLLLAIRLSEESYQEELAIREVKEKTALKAQHVPQPMPQPMPQFGLRQMPQHVPQFGLQQMPQRVEQPLHLNMGEPQPFGAPINKSGFSGGYMFNTQKPGDDYDDIDELIASMSAPKKVFHQAPVTITNAAAIHAPMQPALHVQLERDVPEKKEAQPKLPIVVVGFAGNAEDEKSIKRYTFYKRGEIIAAVESALFEEFGFLNPHGCGLGGQPDFALDFMARACEKAREAVSGYCTDKKYNVVVAAPLLEYYLDQHFRSNPTAIEFAKLYNQMRDVVTKSPKMMGAIQKFDGDTLTAEAKLMNLDRLFVDLNRLGEEYIKYLRALDLDLFMANAPKIDLAHLLTNDKGNPGLPQDGVEIKQKKVARVPLSVGVIDLQKALTVEFDSRKRQFLLDPEETVMSYGNVLAPKFYKGLGEAITDARAKLNLVAPIKMFVSIEDILGFYNNGDIQKIHEHKHPQSSAVRRALETSHRENASQIKFYLKGLTVTQFNYLMEVSSLIRLCYEDLKVIDPDAAGTIITTFFNVLVDQDQKCQAGLVGRLFLAHTAALNQYVDYYQRTTQ